MIFIKIAAWILSGTSIGCTWVQGNGGKLGWKLGVVNSVFWIAYTIATAQWGLIPLNAVMLIINLRNVYTNVETKQEMEWVPSETSEMPKRRKTML